MKNEEPTVKNRENPEFMKQKRQKAFRSPQPKQKTDMPQPRGAEHRRGHFIAAADRKPGTCQVLGIVGHPNSRLATKHGGWGALGVLEFRVEALMITQDLGGGAARGGGGGAWFQGGGAEGPKVEDASGFRGLGNLELGASDLASMKTPKLSKTLKTACGNFPTK